MKARRSVVFLPFLAHILEFLAQVSAIVLSHPKASLLRRSVPALVRDPRLFSKVFNATLSAARASSQGSYPFPTTLSVTPPPTIDSGAHASPTERCIITRSVFQSRPTSARTPSITLDGPLNRFGYNLRSFPDSAFAPILELQVAATNALGRGSTVMINLSGIIEPSFLGTLDQEGKAALPEVGPVPLWGLTLQQPMPSFSSNASAISQSSSPYLTWGA